MVYDIHHSSFITHRYLFFHRLTIFYMKHLLSFCLAFAFLACSLSAQTALQNFVEEYRAQPRFTYAYVSKDLLNNATQLDIQERDWKKIQNIVKNIGSLTILAGDSIRDAKMVYEKAQNIVAQMDMDEMLTVRDGDAKVRILVREEDANISQIVLLVADTHDFVLISFNGQLELSSISELARLLNADQSQDLAKTAAALSVSFSVSPNPIFSDCSLTYANENGDTPLQLTVTDLNGRVVSTIALNGTPTQTFSIGNIPQGTYWLQLKTQQGKVGVKQVQVVRP
jgi:hypothetical protein